MKKFMIKSKYQVNELIREDIISYCYEGTLKYINQTVIIWEYKSIYLNAQLVKKLIDYSEKLVQFHQKNTFKMIDYYYDGKTFYTVHEATSNYITLDTFIKNNDKLVLTQLWKFSTSILNTLLELEHSHLYAGSVNFSDLIVTNKNEIKFTRLMLPILIYKEHWKELDVIEDCIFLAPEYIHSQQYSIRSDMYSFGILLYVFFSQQWPFKYSIRLDHIKKEIVNGYQTFKPIHPKIPDRLCNIIMICLKPDIENRFRSFIELIKAYKSNMDIDHLAKSSASSMVPNLQNYIKKKTRGWYLQLSKVALACTALLLIWFAAGQLFLNYMKAIPEVVVPDLSGLTEEEAEDVLKTYKLNYLNAGVRFHHKVDENFIIETKPPAGRIVKEDRIIRLYFSKGKGPILVPDLVGYTKEDVDTRFADNGLLTKVTHEDYSLQYPSGAIIGQIPPANSFIKPNEYIELVLSKGYPILFSSDKIKSSFFQDKTKLRKVEINLFVLESWGPQEVDIYYTFEKNKEKIYSDLLKPKDDLKLEFELEHKSIVEIYFNNQLTLKKIVDDLEGISNESTI